MEILKQLKKISPDPEYSRRSREFILGLPTRPRSPWQVFVHSLQFGSAIALAGVFLVLVLGGFSTWRFLSPFRLSSLDPADLRAEAQAIDVQIQVVNLHYPESEAESGPAKAPVSISAQSAALPVSNDTPAGTTTPEQAESERLTIDEVLRELAR